jgi:pyridoxine 4-dehydrogenase
MTSSLAPRPDTLTIGETLVVRRLGFGSMQLAGRGAWGPPDDSDQAIRVLRRAVELGVNFIDTADSYGPFVAEQLIHKALSPYPDGLVIATKAGQTRGGPTVWKPVGRPEYLRQQCELSLRHLGVDTIDLFQLHRIDPQVPVADSVGELKALQQEGKIRYIGLSEVTVEQLRQAQQTATIVSVQNLYNLADRSAEDLLNHCERNGIAFIPWFPLATGKLAAPGGPLDEVAAEIGATPSQVALAWLLRRSPVMLPIPGTSSVAHLEENLGAALIELTDEQYEKVANAT